MATVIADVLLVSSQNLIRPVSIELDGSGRIVEVHEGRKPPRGPEVIFDGGGEVYLSAGFIDIHTHGAAGADLSDGTPEAVETIAEAKLAEGVTTFLPTTWTASPEALCGMADAVAVYQQQERFARAPFLHVEGPYLNPRRAGAQAADEMRLPDINEIRSLHERCPVGLVSLAIELEGAVEFITQLNALGIRSSAAHSDASFEEFTEAKEAGLAHLTHYGNQMSGLHHREVGLVGAGLLDDSILIELIIDCIHLSPDMVRLMMKHRDPKQLMLITDSIAASHQGDGVYTVNGMDITVTDGAARLESGALAGSVLTFDEALKNLVEISKQPLNKVIRMCGENQARSLGLTDRGSIQQGMVGDLTLFSPSLDVVATYVGGQCRFQA